VNVDEPIPYIKNKEEEKRLLSLQNHVIRSKPDVKLDLAGLQSDLVNTYADEAGY